MTRDLYFWIGFQSRLWLYFANDDWRTSRQSRIRCNGERQESLSWGRYVSLCKLTPPDRIPVDPSSRCVMPRGMRLRVSAVLSIRLHKPQMDFSGLALPRVCIVLMD